MLPDLFQTPKIGVTFRVFSKTERLGMVATVGFEPGHMAPTGEKKPGYRPLAGGGVSAEPVDVMEWSALGQCFTLPWDLVASPVTLGHIYRGEVFHQAVESPQL